MSDQRCALAVYGRKNEVERSSRPQIEFLTHLWKDIRSETVLLTAGKERFTDQPFPRSRERGPIEASSRSSPSTKTGPIEAQRR